LPFNGILLLLFNYLRTVPPRLSIKLTTVGKSQQISNEGFWNYFYFYFFFVEIISLTHTGSKTEANLR